MLIAADRSMLLVVDVQAKLMPVIDDVETLVPNIVCPQDREVALTRMRDEGIRIVTREMVAFEWLGRAGTPLFRDVSREFLR